MNSDDAIAFLQLHQPMPSDHAITEAEGATYAAILKFLEAHPDNRSVPLLIGSVSASTGLGMYEHISFVLLQHAKEEVTPHLRHFLEFGSDAQKARCCWWAADVSAWELSEIILPLTKSSDEEIRGPAESFIELRNELA